jgi:hypothetical protein
LQGRATPQTAAHGGESWGRLWVAGLTLLPRQDRVAPPPLPVRPENCSSALSSAQPRGSAGHRCGGGVAVRLVRSRAGPDQEQGYVVLELVTVEGPDSLTEQGGELVDG